MSVKTSKIKKKEISLIVQKLRSFLLDLPKTLKVIISISVDVFLCIFTTWISFYLRLGELFPIKYDLLIPSLISVLISFMPSKIT